MFQTDEHQQIPTQMKTSWYREAPKLAHDLARAVFGEEVPKSCIVT